jgi:hypothetical protein
MGVLGNQEPRDYFQSNDLPVFLEDAQALAQEYQVSIETVIEAKKVLELERKNSIQVQNGDYWDEQIAGLGNLLSQLISTMESKY